MIRDKAVTQPVVPRFDWYRSLFTRFLSGITGGSIVLSQQGYTSTRFGDDTGQPIQLEIIQPDVIKKIIKGGSIAAGETYIQGLWRCSDLHALLDLIGRNQSQLDALDASQNWLFALMSKIQHVLRRNNKRQAKKNILAHYDLGNDFYQSFLDSRMQYSAAIYDRDDCTLEQAQENKLTRICEELALKPGDHLLEIGSGWGGLALFAATHYGCKVTTTTISDQQYKYCQAQVKKAGLEDRITLLNQDYRDLTGTYDKLVSIEMIEAVGESFLENFAQRCATHLKPGGRMLLQSITIADDRFEQYRNQVDFIQQYVFPGGFLPSVSMIRELFQKQGLQIDNQFEMGLDYARTLNDWHLAVQAARSEGKHFDFDESFYRLWHFYFAYCESGFRSFNTGTQQFTLVKSAS